jgi:branched-chain amino acid transport system ATP-binding protein
MSGVAAEQHSPASRSTGLPVLEADALTKSFGGLTAVSTFSLELFAGEIVGLIGPNGAGKTTCFNLLTGVYVPDSGVIQISGRDVTGCRADRIIAQGVARTFQNIRLFRDMTVLENVKVGFHTRVKTGLLASVLRSGGFRREEAAIEAEALELLKLFGLEQHAHRLGRTLPYGGQRKLEIARALAARPKVLLLDEPAAGMNESESAALRELLLEVRERFALSVLLIEHDMPFVMGLAKRLLVLDHGVTIAAGTPEEIRASPAVIEAYLGKSE